MMRIAAVVIVILGLQGLGWWVAGWPKPAGPDVAGGRLQSLSFAPYRPGQSPFTGVFPSEAEVAADIALLAPYVHTLRTYAAIEGKYEVAALAERAGLRLWQGIWLGGDRAQNAREIAAAIDVARRHPAVVDRVVVGNEVLLRRDLPVGELIAAIDQVRAAVPQRVTYADVWEFWEQFPEVADHVDIVTVHLLPYWEDDPVPVEAAIAHVAAVYRRMVARFPGKTVVIGEVGWPSRGRWRADAAPGLLAQARFVRGVLDLAAREGFEANLIEAFDQEWKVATEGTVGPSWGLWTAGRVGKFALAGPVSDVPDWGVRAATGGVLGLGLVWLGVMGRWGAPGAVRVAGVAMGLGAALGWAAWESWPIAWGVGLQVAAAGNLAGQALLAALLLRRAGAVWAGERVAPGWTMAEATAAVREGRLRGWDAAGMGWVFLWTGAVLQVLLLVDSRYRDFPLVCFVVPVMGVGLRVWLRDWPARGGRQEAVAGLVLAGAAVLSLLREGVENQQAVVWTMMALVLAGPALVSLRRGG